MLFELLEPMTSKSQKTHCQMLCITSTFMVVI